MAVRLGSVDPSKYPDEAFDLYSIPAFERGEPDVLEGNEIGSAKQTVQPGDVLLSRIVPHIRRAWVVGEKRGRRIIASGEWIVFRGESVDSRYLRRVLVSDPFHAQFMRTVSGVGGSLLRARPAYVGKIRISLPPLPEQQRIAEGLDRVDALRAKRRTAIFQVERLLESGFIQTFGDPLSNPRAWPLQPLGAVAKVQGGLQLSRSRETLPIEVPYLRVANVHRALLNLSEIKTMRATAAEVARTTLLENDLLVVEGHGNAAEIGRCALWDGSVPVCIHQNHLIRVRFDREAVEPVFANIFLNSYGGRQHLLRSGNTTSGLNTISVADVRATPIAIPPIGLQRRFVATAAKILALKVRQDASAAELDALFASLQHRAFRGEL